MSEDSISYGEDKENLLYIARKINVDEFGLGEEGPFRESISADDSDVSVKPIGSELRILEDIDSVSQNLSDPQVARRFKPFNFKWTYGMNVSVGMLNLSNETRKELFFASVHMGILYNYCTREMRHLEGHQSMINCISSDGNGDWLVTSDGDKDGCLIVWNTKDLNPVFMLFGIYPENGILLMAMSPCARYLITIGENSQEYYQVDLWLWTLGEERPDDTYLVYKSHGPPVKICFNPDVEEHIMVVFQKQVFLITLDPNARKIIQSTIPTITNRDKVGELTCGTYVNQCHECYASSSRGCILVFRNSLYGKNFEDSDLSNSKMYINAVKITHASIGVITTTEGVLVVGDSKGHVFFFDKKIRILYWIRNSSIVKPVTGISFGLCPKTYRFEESKIVIKDRPLEDANILDCTYSDIEAQVTKLIDAPFDASIENKTFTVGDFFISTADNNIYAYDFIRNVPTPLFHAACANLSCIDTHDEMPYVIVGYENGRVTLFDFEQKEMIASHVLPKPEEGDGGDTITCIKYSPQSLHLICGRANGEIWVLEPVILTPKCPPFKYGRFKVVKIDFAHDSLQFAYFDENRTLFLFMYNTEETCWKLRGKIRPHYDQIHDMAFFSIKPETSTLYTIGADRYLVEYNNLDLRFDSDLEFSTTMRERIEQSATPMTFTFYRKPVGERQIGYILLADDKYKLKTLHAVTKVPRTLVLGPAFGCFQNSHIKKMRIVPQHKSRYMIFVTKRHIGIHILPLDGNPFKYTGYLAHPIEIGDFALSHNGLYAFTFGREGRSVLQWEIKTRSVDLTALMGGTEMEPFYCLLEGGKNGWLFQEIQDLFFYMQILQQENIDLPRRVSDSINLTDMSDLVRTCGYYPSHFELETMMIDIRYRDFDETGIVRDEISFVEFVKLFINHRPAHGYSLDTITENFNTICQMAEYPKRGRIDSHDFVYLLQSIGEPSPTLHRDLTTLLRISTYGENNYEFLPSDINKNYLLYEILGIDPEVMGKDTGERGSDVANLSVFSDYAADFRKHT